MSSKVTNNSGNSKAANLVNLYGNIRRVSMSLQPATENLNMKNQNGSFNNVHYNNIQMQNNIQQILQQNNQKLELNNNIQNLQNKEKRNFAGLPQVISPSNATLSTPKNSNNNNSFRDDSNTSQKISQKLSRSSSHNNSNGNLMNEINNNNNINNNSINNNNQYEITYTTVIDGTFSEKDTKQFLSNNSNVSQNISFPLFSTIDYYMLFLLYYINYILLLLNVDSINLNFVFLNLSYLLILFFHTFH